MKLDPGIWAATGAAVLFGLSTPYAKLLSADIPPLLLSGLLYSGAGLGLAALLGIRAAAGGALLGRSPAGRQLLVLPRGAALGWLGGAVLCGGLLAPYLLLRGLQQTDAATASLTLNLEGVFTALLAWTVFHENVDRRILLGMSAIIAGGLVLALAPLPAAGATHGTLLVAAACLCWGIDNNLTRKVAINDAMSIACAKGLLAGPASIALALQGGARWPAAPLVTQAAVLGFVGYGLSLTLFVVALRRLGTARTGAYFSLAPFIGALLAVALGAPLSATLAVAGALMAYGVWLHVTEHHAHAHRHERLEHAHAHVHDLHHRHHHAAHDAGPEPHSHTHVHEPLEHAHAHFPDAHHRHRH